MLQKMDDLLQKRKKAKLYRQWTANSGLPVEEMPPDLLREPRERQASGAAFAREREGLEDPGSGSQQSVDLRIINQYMQHIFLLWLIITVLLVMLAIAFTLLFTWQR